MCSSPSGGWDVQDQEAADPVSGEDPLPASRTAVLSFCPLMVEGVSELSGVPCVRVRAEPSWPGHLSKAPPSNATTLRVGFNTYLRVTQSEWAGPCSQITLLVDTEFFELRIICMCHSIQFFTFFFFSHSETSKLFLVCKLSKSRRRAGFGLRASATSSL